MGGLYGLVVPSGPLVGYPWVGGGRRGTSTVILGTY